MITAFFVLILIFLGACVGSFINAWAWRAHENLPIGNARSMCPNCRTKISWYDNVPLLSFILLRGKCRACQKAISFQYPIVELGGIFLFLVVGFFHHFSFADYSMLIRDLCIVSILLAILVYDAKYMEILDRTTLFPATLIFLFNFFTNALSWQSMIMGAGIGAGFFGLQYAISRGRWIGGGDIRLGALMGVILGTPLIWVALFLSYLLGGIVGAVLLGMKKAHANTALPFGLFLIPGTLLTLFFGADMLEWYLALLR